MFDVILLAGGKLEKDFKSQYNVENKAYIPIAGKMMSEYVVNNIQECDLVNRIVFVAPSPDVPQSIKDHVSGVALGGSSIIRSLKSGFDALSQPTEKVLVIPCDVPFLKKDAIKEFLSQCEKRQADIYYSYLGKEDSEKEYPGLHHTYVRLADGVFCGGSLVLLSSKIAGSMERLFESITEYRKNPLRLAFLLGLVTIVKLISGRLNASLLEEKFSMLLGVNVAGVRVRYAEIGFNVDDLVVLRQAEMILGGEKKKTVSIYD